MNRWGFCTCAIVGVTAATALAEPFDNQMWYRGAPSTQRIPFLRQLYDTTRLKEQMPRPESLGAYGNPVRGPVPTAPRDIHGRWILGGPLSSSDGFLNAAGDAMGVSVLTPDGGMPLDLGEPTRLTDNMQLRHYGPPTQPAQVVMTERDIKAAQAMELFFADLGNDEPQPVRGRLMALARVESASGNFSRLVVTVKSLDGRSHELVVGSQDTLEKHNIKLGDEVAMEADARVVDGQKLLFAVNLRPVAVAQAATKD